MKIYIAGKVTGEPISETTKKFTEAKKQIEARGHEAINPVEVVNNWNATWQEAMKMCIAALMTADAVYLLPCVRHSKGAKLEMELATQLGMYVCTTIFSFPKE